MKIAILSSPWTAYPPDGFGGIELIVSYLCEGLIAKGHSVTLCAVKNNIPGCESLYLYKDPLGSGAYANKDAPLILLNHVYHCLKELPADTDIIHNNCETYALHLLNSFSFPFVNTLHGAYYKNLHKDRRESDTTIESFINTLKLFENNNFVSISKRQRAEIQNLNYRSNIFNAIKLDNFIFNDQPDNYVGWLGRFSHVKGLDIAIQVCLKEKKELRISAFIRDKRESIFQKEIAPYINHSQINYVGYINQTNEKSSFYGKSKVFLFPIQWEEPFGLVMIEAMACGTPVIGFARGSVPEVIKDGETGFIVNSSDEDIRGDWIIKKTGSEGLCEALERIYTLPEEKYRQMRRNCREHVAKYFTVERMVDEYEKVYEEILSEKK